MNYEKIKREIVEIFQNSQSTAATHQKNSILLKKVFEKTDLETFLTALLNPLNIILQIDFKQRNIFVEKSIEFIASFCATLESQEIKLEDQEDEEFIEHPLLTKIFEYLLQTSQLVPDVVRFRSCQIINKILDRLVGNEVSNDLCNKLKKSLIIRLKDPKNVIRLQAIISLFRLQDPTDPEDEIIDNFVTMIKSDAIAKVRQICVEKTAARKDVIPHIILRTRDVDLNVRLAAFKRLSKFAVYLKVADKRLILKCGCLDASEKIRNYVCNTLLTSWLEHYDNDILKLMKSVRLDADEKDIKETSDLNEYILSALFKDKSLKDLSQVLPLDENKLIPIEYLNWETVSYWRIYVQFLSQRDEFEEERDNVIPELVHFCRYIKDFYTNAQKDLTTEQFLEQQYTIKQFFLMTKTYDFADPTNRQCLNSLAHNILEKTELMSDVTEIIIGNLECSIPNVSGRIRFVTEMISEIMCPMNSEEAQREERDKEFQMSQLKVRLNCLMEDQKIAIETKQYLDAERIQRELEEVNNSIMDLRKEFEQPETPVKKTDIQTILKYLDITCGLLLSPQITKLTSTLQSLREDVIQEMLIHDNDSVRCKALHCYALCCILDKATARNGIHIFSTPILAYKAGEECDTQTLLVCIGAVVDLLRIYGSHLMAEPDDELSESRNEEHQRIFMGGTSLTDLIQGLVDLMDDELYEIQERAAIGLCKLVLSERVHSPTLISRLILKWCTPASEDDDTDRLKQIVGFMLEQIAMLPGSADQLEGAVLTTIRALAQAPKISPLADINIENTAKFMLALCKISPAGPQIHENLAMSICFQINEKPKYKLNSLYSKMLLMLDIPDSKIVIRELIGICDQIRDNITERLTLNNIIKYVGQLNEKNVANLSVIAEDDQAENNQSEQDDSGNSRNI